MPTIERRVVAVVSMMLAVGGCARDAGVSAQRTAAFQAARDQCGVTVVETSEVQRCMRAKGFVYRYPWQ